MVKISFEELVNILESDKKYDINFSFDFYDFQENTVKLIVNVNNENGFEYYITNRNVEIETKFQDFHLLDFEDEILPMVYDITLNKLY